MSSTDKVLPCALCGTERPKYVIFESCRIQPRRCDHFVSMHANDFPHIVSVVVNHGHLERNEEFMKRLKDLQRKYTICFIHDENSTCGSLFAYEFAINNSRDTLMAVPEIFGLFTELPI